MWLKALSERAGGGKQGFQKRMKSNKYHVALEKVGIWDKDNYEMSSSLSLDFINWILGLIKKKTNWW